MSGRYDFSLGHAWVRGTTLTRTFVYQDDEGEPIDISGYTAHMQVRKISGGTIFLDCAEYLTINGPLGQISLSVPSTQLLKPDVYRYDLLLNSESTVIALISGKFEVIDNITEIGE